MKLNATDRRRPKFLHEDLYVMPLVLQPNLFGTACDTKCECWTIKRRGSSGKRHAIVWPWCSYEQRYRGPDVNVWRCRPPQPICRCRLLTSQSNCVVEWLNFTEIDCWYCRRQHLPLEGLIPPSFPPPVTRDDLAPLHDWWAERGDTRASLIRKELDKPWPPFGAEDQPETT